MHEVTVILKRLHSSSFQVGAVVASIVAVVVLLVVRRRDFWTKSANGSQTVHRGTHETVWMMQTNIKTMTQSVPAHDTGRSWPCCCSNFIVHTDPSVSYGFKWKYVCPSCGELQMMLISSSSRSLSPLGTADASNDLAKTFDKSSNDFHPTWRNSDTYDNDDCEVPPPPTSTGILNCITSAHCTQWCFPLSVLSVVERCACLLAFFWFCCDCLAVVVPWDGPAARVDLDLRLWTTLVGRRLRQRQQLHGLPRLMRLLYVTS